MKLDHGLDGADLEPIRQPLADPEAEKMAHALAHLWKHHQFDQDNTQDAASESMLQSFAIKLIGSAVKQYKKGRGTLPGHLEEALALLLAPPTVSWREILRNYVASRISAKPVRGMQRVSKVLAAMQHHLKRSPTQRMREIAKRMAIVPGTSYDRQYRIFFVVDTSGSMSDSDINLALSELYYLQKSGADIIIRVFYVDAEVAKEYELEVDGNIDPQILGRGGTDFDTALRHIAKLGEDGDRCDLVVYATDGFCSKPRTKLPCDVLWLTTPTGQELMKDEPGNTVIRMINYPTQETA